QTKNPLSFEFAGVQYTAEPWGPIEAPDGLVDSMLKVGLPLGHVEIAPETRVAAKAADDVRTAERKRADDLEKQLRLAVAEKVQAVQSVEDAVSKAQVSQGIADLAEMKVEELTSRLESANAELAATLDQLREAKLQVEKLTDQLALAPAPRPRGRPRKDS
ncbi:MAG: hypothetical protein ACYTBJ_25100, partial [Planctomycetota bacterium]